MANAVVSFTWDDGRASQYALYDIFRPRGLKPGTFYLNTALVGEANKLTWEQIASLAGIGAELGPHTAHHTPLNTVDHAAAAAEYQADIDNLTAQGYPRPLSVSYPNGITTTTTDGYPIPQIPKDLGFTSGRSGINTIHHDTIPPGDQWLIRQAVAPLGNTTTLAGLQATVTSSEGGGTVGPWVVFNTHDIDGPSGLPSAVLEQFLDWLGPRAAHGTVLKSVTEVIQPAEARPGSP
ncbi:MAG: polysaccharide deacetylase family protein [Streptosporangiaceae bacterium]|nr:polysaccharide deacetylase family protein [Streptosporangiaceae bacterium]